MSEKNYYNKTLAESYDIDAYDIKRHLLTKALHQVTKVIPHEHQIDTLLDVAVGTGNAFVETSRLLNVNHYIGNDLSEHMLEIAKQRFPKFKAITGSAIDLDKMIPSSSIDLIYVHMLLSYLNSKELLKKLYALLKPGGLLSLTTSTEKNLRDAQQRFTKAVPWLFNFRKIFSEVTMPQSIEAIEKLACELGFEIVGSETHQQTICMQNFNDIWRYANDSGWHLQYTTRTGVPWLDKFMFHCVAKFIEWFVPGQRYPVNATTDIAILTLRKPC